MSSLVYLLVRSPPPHIPNFFTQSVSSFRNTCPYHCNLFCCSINIISSIPSLSQLLPWNSICYLNITHPSDHSHLCSLKCHLIFFPDRPGLTSVYHTTSHTTAIQPASLNQLYIPIGKQWYQSRDGSVQIFQIRFDSVWFSIKYPVQFFSVLVFACHHPIFISFFQLTENEIQKSGSEKL